MDADAQLAGFLSVPERMKTTGLIGIEKNPRWDKVTNAVAVEEKKKGASEIDFSTWSGASCSCAGKF
jgi:hypothetical protein